MADDERSRLVLEARAWWGTKNAYRTTPKHIEALLDTITETIKTALPQITVGLYITQQDPGHVHFKMFVNHALCHSAEQPLCLQVEEFKEFARVLRAAVYEIE